MLRSTIVTTCLLLAACGPPPVTPDAPPIVPDETSLGVGDVFDLRVYGEEELSGTFRVANNGLVQFPFIGEVEIEGLEPEAVAQAVATRLQDGGFIREPQVTVFVQEYNSKQVSVVGEVRRPGTFPMTTGLTVVQALSLAGGTTGIADTSRVVVTRRVDDELQRYTVPVEAVTEGRAADFPLRAGDIVYVRQRVF